MKKDFIVRRSITMVEGEPHVETYSEQELIRCKDCKWWNITTATFPTKGFCGCYHGEHEGDWFCADGEKRSE